MLLNIAEDLKEYAKVLVSPVSEKKDQAKKGGEDKPMTLDEMKGMAQKSAEDL